MYYVKGVPFRYPTVISYTIEMLIGIASLANYLFSVSLTSVCLFVFFPPVGRDSLGESLEGIRGSFDA